jgi:hypothetical protein
MRPVKSTAPPAEAEIRKGIAFSNGFARSVLVSIAWRRSGTRKVARMQDVRMMFLYLFDHSVIGHFAATRTSEEMQPFFRR